MKDGKIGIGIVGSKFVSTIHAEALKTVHEAEILAVASPSSGHAEAFSKQYKIPNHYTDFKRMLEMDEIDMILVGAPNAFHCPIMVDAARAGKHVVVEKPLCLNLQEADLMIETCEKANVKLMYAEELCFAPKYVRLKQLLDQGALGVPVLIKQSEKHDGPHAPHFWDVEQSGGVDYAVEKAGSTKGWSFTIYEEIWNYGFPKEIAHFVDCVKNDKQPQVTGEDGRAVLEAIYAAYESAGSGQKVLLPFNTNADKPYKLWKK